eukprot:365479-Chlamydomonas_euryale.AAC.5
MHAPPRPPARPGRRMGAGVVGGSVVLRLLRGAAGGRRRAVGGRVQLHRDTHGGFRAVRDEQVRAPNQSCTTRAGERRFCDKGEGRLRIPCHLQVLLHDQVGLLAGFGCMESMRKKGSQGEAVPPASPSPPVHIDLYRFVQICALSASGLPADLLAACEHQDCVRAQQGQSTPPSGLCPHPHHEQNRLKQRRIRAGTDTCACHRMRTLAAASTRRTPRCEGVPAAPASARSARCGRPVPHLAAQTCRPAAHTCCPAAHTCQPRCPHMLAPLPTHATVGPSHAAV